MHITNDNKVVLTHFGQPYHYPNTTLGTKRTVVVWHKPAIKDHAFFPSPLPLLGSGGKLEEEMAKLMGQNKDS